MSRRSPAHSTVNAAVGRKQEVSRNQFALAPIWWYPLARLRISILAEETGGAQVPFLLFLCAIWSLTTSTACFSAQHAVRAI